MTQLNTLTYSIRQADREWEWEGDRLVSVDGIHVITQDPVYGYYRLTTQEDTTESIRESMIPHHLVLYADTLVVERTLGEA